jgi:hypothetical protein
MKLPLVPAALVSALLCLPALCAADPIEPCPPPDSGVMALAFPDGMPAALVKALKDQVADIASPGEPFDATDVIVTGRRWRAMFVWNRGSRYLIATEHGGRDYNNPLFLFDLASGDEEATLVTEAIAFPPTVCGTSNRLIAGQ